MSSEHLSAIHSMMQQMGKSVLGQEEVVRTLTLALLCNGNVLLEGLPGTAKTRSIKTLSQVLQAKLGRIQFTPDLLPSDVTGNEIYLDSNQGKSELQFQPGPIFSELVLADEINRAPAKVQSALLEAMEERQVTVAGKTYKLPALFMVLATQNPIEQEGTYPLPEAQMDRFLMKISVDYPQAEAELAIVRMLQIEEGAKGEQLQMISQDPYFCRPRDHPADERVGASGAIHRRPGHGHPATRTVRRQAGRLDRLRFQPQGQHRPASQQPRQRLAGWARSRHARRCALGTARHNAPPPDHQLRRPGGQDLPGRHYRRDYPAGGRGLRRRWPQPATTISTPACVP